jgi:hypothetical protein
VFEDDLRALNDAGASYMLLSTALETHHAIFSSLTHRDLADNTGYLVAFNDLIREFKGRAVGVPSGEPSTSQARRLVVIRSPGAGRGRISS